MSIVEAKFNTATTLVTNASTIGPQMPSTPQAPAFPSRDSPQLMVYLKPRVRGQRTAALDNLEKIQTDADFQRRFATLNKLLGSTDAVADIKKGFVQNLYTPRKVSVPHPHVIKDLMQPDQNVADQAVWNPQHITKTYRLEPKLQQQDQGSPYDDQISAKEFLAKQRKAAQIELAKRQEHNTSMQSKLAAVVPKGKPVPESIEIKTSKLLNVIEKEKYDHLQVMIDQVDYESRMKIKKKDWFIDPDHSMSARKMISIQKTLGYAKKIMQQRLEPFIGQRCFSSDHTPRRERYDIQNATIEPQSNFGSRQTSQKDGIGIPESQLQIKQNQRGIFARPLQVTSQKQLSEIQINYDGPLSQRGISEAGYLSNTKLPSDVPQTALISPRILARRRVIPTRGFGELKSPRNLPLVSPTNQAKSTSISPDQGIASSEQFQTRKTDNNSQETENDPALKETLSGALPEKQSQAQLNTRKPSGAFLMKQQNLQIIIERRNRSPPTRDLDKFIKQLKKDRSPKRKENSKSPAGAEPVKMNQYDINFGKAIKLSERKKRQGPLNLTMGAEEYKQQKINHFSLGSQAKFEDMNKDLAILKNDKILKLSQKIQMPGGANQASTFYSTPTESQAISTMKKKQAIAQQYRRSEKDQQNKALSGLGSKTDRLSPRRDAFGMTNAFTTTNGISGPATQDNFTASFGLSPIIPPQSLSAFAGLFSSDAGHAAIQTKEIISDDLPESQKDTVAYHLPTPRTSTAAMKIRKSQKKL